MKKLLLGIAALALIAIAGSLWWAYNSLDAQIASAIRRYGSEITGVSISLSKAQIDPLDGKAALYSLIVGNPDGFKTKHALFLGEISMKLDIGSLATDVIRIKELILIKPEVTYESVRPAETTSTCSNAILSAQLAKSMATGRKLKTRNPTRRNSSSSICTSRTVPSA